MSRDSTAAVRPVDIAFLFHVAVDGFAPLGEFVAVEQLGVEREPFTYQEGGRNDSVHQLLGPAKYHQLVLRWGLMDRTGLWEWLESVRIGRKFRRDGTIHQYTRRGETPIRVYSFRGAWPVAWKGPALDASNSQIPLEELRLAIDHLTVEVRNAR